MHSKAEDQASLEKRGPVERETLYRGRIITLRKDMLQVEGRPPQKWEIVVHPGAVVIIPITSEGNILLVSQWRRAIEKIILELPAGTLEKNEDPLVCAGRELQEETGFKAASIIPLGGFYSAPGFCTEYLHLFIAEDLEESPLQADEDEGIDVVSVSLEDALRMIDDDTISDAKTIAGILRYHRWKQR